MAHDVVIANGVVVDGTGAPRRQADVAIDGDRITIDATGKVVTPGSSTSIPTSTPSRRC